MTIGYASSQSLLNDSAKWSQLRSYTYPPLAPNQFSPSFNNAGLFTTSGSTYTRTSGTANSWTTGQMWSTVGLSTGTFIWQMANLNSMMVGVSTNNTTVNYTAIDWGLSFYNSGATVEVYNGGGSGGTIAGGWTTSQVWKMVWTASQIFYYVDNVLQKTYSRPNSNPMYVDCAFYALNSGVTVNYFGLG